MGRDTFQPDSPTTDRSQAAEESTRTSCPACGHEDGPARRLEVTTLVREALDQVLSFDTKIGRTARDFTLRPGAAALDYVRGARSRYVNPLKYLVFAVAAYLVALAITGSTVSDLAGAGGISPDRPITAELVSEIGATLDRTLRILILATPPIMAWVTGPLLGRGRFNFAEACCLWIFVTAHSTLTITVVGTLLDGLLGQVAQFWLIPVAVAYHAWAARGFFQRELLPTVLATLAALVASQVFLIGVVALCVVAALWLTYGPPGI